MNHFKLFLKQFSTSFTLLWVPFLSVSEFIREDEPTFWDYFFAIASTSFVIILVVLDIIALRKTLKKTKRELNDGNGYFLSLKSFLPT